MDIWVIWAIDIQWRLVIFQWFSGTLRSTGEELEKIFVWMIY